MMTTGEKHDKNGKKFWPAILEKGKELKAVI
jgi:hypothetical protein